SPQDPAQGFEFKPTSVPMKAPTQAPFDMNDPRNPVHRAAGIYHWTPVRPLFCNLHGSSFNMFLLNVCCQGPAWN
ncbi:MAG: hypothetical protein ACKOD8_04960, partial [Limnohabitans sp.]